MPLSFFLKMAFERPAYVLAGLLFLYLGYVLLAARSIEAVVAHCITVVLIFGIYGIFMYIVMGGTQTKEAMFGRLLIEFRDDLAQRYSTDPGSFDGCSDEEINILIQAQNVTQFPPVYQEFLLKSGKGVNGLKQDIAFFYDDLLALKARAQQAAFAQGEWQLGEDLFVFVGYENQFLIFPAEDTGDEPDDPPVFFFSDTEYLKPYIDRLSGFIAPFVS